VCKQSGVCVNATRYRFLKNGIVWRPVALGRDPYMRVPKVIPKRQDSVAKGACVLRVLGVHRCCSVVAPINSAQEAGLVY
jgi:hypothetical protein